MKKLLIICVLAATFTACNNDKKAADANTTDNTTTTNTTTTPMTTGWDQSTRDKYRTQCEQSSMAQFKNDAGKTKAYCDCLVAKAEARYPMADSAANMTMAVAQELAKDCMPK